MGGITFDEYWGEFLRDHRGDKDGGYYASDQLLNYVQRLPERKRAAFLDELVSVAIEKSEGYSCALSVLQIEAMPRHVRAICEYITPLPHPDSVNAEGELVAYLRVPASDPGGLCIDLIEQFLFDRPIGHAWTGILHTLWPHYPDLFCRGWVRYFTSRPSEEWRNTGIPQAFLSRSEQLSALKPKLCEASEAAWQELRQVLWNQRDATWLSEEEKRSLVQILES